MTPLVLATVLIAQSGPGAQLDANDILTNLRITQLEDSRVQGVFNADVYIPPGGDLADAIATIQQDPDCSSVEGDQSVGCTILLNRAIYPTKTINICRALRIVGVGTGRAWGAATVVRTSSTTALHIRGADWCEANGFLIATGGRRANGAWSSVEHVRFEDISTATAAVYSVGAHLEARAKFEDCSFDGFTQGVRISAGVERTEDASGFFYQGSNTNANSWALRDVVVSNSRHTGVFIDGADVNAGYSIGLDVSSNCAHRSSYPELGACANLHDSSFLNNTHIAPHSATANGGYQFYTDNPNSRVAWVGAYAEVGNGESEASRRDLVLGGIGTWNNAGDGVTLVDEYLSGVCTWDSRSRPYGESLCFGRLAGGGLLQARGEVAPFAANQALRLKLWVTGGEAAFLWDVANLGAKRVFWVPTGDATFTTERMNVP